MKFLTKTGSEAFLSELGFNSSGKLDDAVGSGKELLYLSDVENMQSHIVFARHLERWLHPYSQVFLFITEFGIWPSDEDSFLNSALRTYCGETDPLYLKPGHVFGKADKDALISFMQISLRSGWGGWLIAVNEQGAPTFAMQFSHDGWIKIGPQSNLRDIQNDLNELNIASSESLV